MNKENVMEAEKNEKDIFKPKFKWMIYGADVLAAVMIVSILALVLTHVQWDSAVFVSIAKSIPDWNAFYWTSIAICVLAYLGVFFMVSKPSFDEWIFDIASRKLGSQWIKYTRTKLYVNFDRNLNKNDIMNFIREISDKSERFTYYYGAIDFRKGEAEISISKRRPLPTMATWENEKDMVWNIIPLGDAVNHRLKTVTPICWTLNNENKRKDILESQPSTSLLIAGGTGSGKSVLQQCILKHINKFHDYFMFVGCDVKMVEFVDFLGLPGVRKIALSVEEVSESVDQVRRLMYQRYAFMKDHHVNDVYKAKNVEVNYYQLGDRSYQFDEIMSCKVNGKSDLLTVEEIYNLLEDDEEVELDDGYSF